MATRHEPAKKFCTTVIPTLTKVLEPAGSVIENGEREHFDFMQHVKDGNPQSML